ncbi:MAG: MarR family winged helix-turn-helix transcriptional regulator [Kineosporiaceae bacterium]
MFPTGDLQDELGFELTRHARLLHVVKARMALEVPAGVDVAAVGLLMMLIRCGSRRQGELAEAAMLDPSTTSRYVAALARAGLVERRADPDDGRAVHLVATTAGERLGADLMAHRQAMVREMLDGWSVNDLEVLLSLVRRLNDALEQHRPSVGRDPDSPTTPKSSTPQES